MKAQKYILNPCNCVAKLSMACSTHSFDNHIDALKFKISRQDHRWNNIIVEAVRVSTYCAMKVHMKIFRITLAGIIAHGVFYRPGAVLDTMDQLIGFECFKGPE